MCELIWQGKDLARMNLQKRLQDDELSKMNLPKGMSLSKRSLRERLGGESFNMLKTLSLEEKSISKGIKTFQSVYFFTGQITQWDHHRTKSN